MPEIIPSVARIRDFRLQPVALTGRFDAFTGQVSFQELNAGKTDRWAGTYTFVPAPRATLAQLTAWLLRLGRVGTFFAFDPDRRSPLSGFSDSVTVAGGLQSGRTINVNGAANGTLLAGDYVQIGSQYFLVTGDVATGVLPIWPALRTSPANLAPVVVVNPVMTARITSTPEWARSPGARSEISISFEEVV